MILAVDIIGDSAPDRNGGRAWDDRKKPTGGHRQLKDICQQDTGLASNKARAAIEGNEAIQRPRQQQRAARVEAAVAITAAVTVGQDGGTDGNDWKRIVAASQPIHDG